MIFREEDVGGRERRSGVYQCINGVFSRRFAVSDVKVIICDIGLHMNSASSRVASPILH